MQVAGAPPDSDSDGATTTGPGYFKLALGPNTLPPLERLAALQQQQSSSGAGLESLGGQLGLGEPRAGRGLQVGVRACVRDSTAPVACSSARHKPAARAAAPAAAPLGPAALPMQSDMLVVAFGSAPGTPNWAGLLSRLYKAGKNDAERCAEGAQCAQGWSA